MNEGINLKDVDSDILTKIVRWCEFHLNDSPQVPVMEDNLGPFDRIFVDVNQATLMSILKAADYLQVEGLIELCCWRLAKLMQSKSPEQMRLMFNS